MEQFDHVEIVRPDAGHNSGLAGRRREKRLLERDDKKWEPVFVLKSRENKESGA